MDITSVYGQGALTGQIIGFGCEAILSGLKASMLTTEQGIVFQAPEWVNKEGKGAQFFYNMLAQYTFCTCHKEILQPLIKREISLIQKNDQLRQELESLKGQEVKKLAGNRKRKRQEAIVAVDGESPRSVKTRCKSRRSAKELVTTEARQEAKAREAIHMAAAADWISCYKRGGNLDERKKAFYEKYTTGKVYDEKRQAFTGKEVVSTCIQKVYSGAFRIMNEGAQRIRAYAREEALSRKLSKKISNQAGENVCVKKDMDWKGMAHKALSRYKYLPDYRNRTSNIVAQFLKRNPNEVSVYEKIYEHEYKLVADLWRAAKRAVGQNGSSDKDWKSWVSSWLKKNNYSIGWEMRDIKKRFNGVQIGEEKIYLNIAKKAAKNKWAKLKRAERERDGQRMQVQAAPRVVVINQLNNTWMPAPYIFNNGMPMGAPVAPFNPNAPLVSNENPAENNEGSVGSDCNDVREVPEFPDLEGEKVGSFLSTSEDLDPQSLLSDQAQPSLLPEDMREEMESDLERWGNQPELADLGDFRVELPELFSVE